MLRTHVRSGSRAVDLRPLPDELIDTREPGGHEHAGAEFALVEQLDPLRPEDVEAICAQLGFVVRGEAGRVQLSGLARRGRSDFLCGAEELDPAIGPPPRLARVVDRDRRRSTGLDVPRM